MITGEKVCYQFSRLRMRKREKMCQRDWSEGGIGIKASEKVSTLTLCKTQVRIFSPNLASSICEDNNELPAPQTPRQQIGKGQE